MAALLTMSRDVFIIHIYAYYEGNSIVYTLLQRPFTEMLLIFTNYVYLLPHNKSPIRSLNIYLQSCSWLNRNHLRNLNTFFFLFELSLKLIYNFLSENADINDKLLQTVKAE